MSSEQTSEFSSLPELPGMITRLGQRPGAIHFLHGHSSVFTIGLLMASATQQPLVVIDGAMRFNSYRLSTIAQRLKLPPKEVLHRTYITRSFTAFQTEAAITTKLPRFLQTHPCPLVVILGLLDTYYDEQIKARECQQSLQRILRALRTLTARNIHVLIVDVEVAVPPPGKEMLFQLVHHSSDVVMRLEGTEQKVVLQLK